MDNQQATLNAYIAGIWDGEGTFCLSERNHSIKAQITEANTDIEITRKIIEFLKVNDINYHLQTLDRKKTGRKIQYQVAITTHHGRIKFCELLEQYLTKNKEYAEVLKNFCKYMLNCYTKWKESGGNGGVYQRKNNPYKFLRTPKKFIKFEEQKHFLDEYEKLRESSETLSRTIHKFE